MRRFSILFIFTLNVGSSTHAFADVCEKWFAASKLKVGKNCLLECAVLPVDMGTFDCPNACPNFCKESVGTDFVFKVSAILV